MQSEILEKALLAIEKIENPILVFVNGESEEAMLVAKKLFLEKKAEVILLGDSMLILRRARLFKVNVDQLYGVIDPNEHADLEKVVSFYAKNNPTLSKKEVISQVKKAEVLAQILVDMGSANIIIN